MRCLFITRNVDENFGGGKVTFRNLNYLEEMKIEVIKVFIVQDKSKFVNSKDNIFIEGSKNRKETLMNSLKLYNGGLSPKARKEISEIIYKEKIDFIFYDGSYYGRLINKIKKYDAAIKHITFFHNIEKNFILDLVKTEGIKYLPVYIAAWFNEYLAIKKSDILIALNERESIEMKKIYGKKADYKMPVSLEDKFNKEKIVERENHKELKLLFLGSYFYPNYNGIKWFVENVMNSITNAKLYIVGKGFEEKREELERENVEVIGSCDNVEQFYYESDIFIAPIFIGAGMKVKTAEALMYGKTILGSSETFEGYEIEDFDKVGGLCNNREEYIDKIRTLYNDKNFKRLNSYSRELFLEKYSNSSLKFIMKEIYQKISEGR